MDSSNVHKVFMETGRLFDSAKDIADAIADNGAFKLGAVSQSSTGEFMSFRSAILELQIR
jgi:hypothetical protein